MSRKKNQGLLKVGEPYRRLDDPSRGRGAKQAERGAELRPEWSYGESI